MHMVTVALRGPQRGDLPVDVLDILWVASSIEDGVEHLHAKRLETGSLGYLTFFIKAATPEKAAALARRIVSRALVNSPLLSGWHLVPERS
ncbi:hypothetical protein QMZ92_19590 [Streptomyces sp. HNM0645]|uniref:hypothetical protein n=1 Tax=Streptomyces sp. HNM0645 TaxID=2782343 RepID=UPI0024B65854|nr:hypothetical protein [Streptomyces sp. HNM0645]MDI9886518.1 hypothetical protein [Streptomyces sp. HNM0645]